MIPTDALAEVFVEIADTLVDDFDLIEFLQMVTSRTSALVGTTAVGLLLADHNGRLQLMAASNERAELVEMFQVQSSEGPCQDCFRQGGAVVNVDLQAATWRWPRFAPLAVRNGFRSVHAFPLRLRREVLGALNLFGDETGGLNPEDARVIQSLADVATIGLLQERAVRRGEVVSEQLQSALTSRVIIEQAKGVLSQILGCTPDEAFERMRSYARSRGQKLGAVASVVVTDPSSAPGLIPPR